MGATAEVGEGALGVGCYVAVFELADELAFIGLAAVAEHCQGVGFRDVGAHNGLLFAGELKHFLFDFWEIGVGDGVLSRVDVVVEAVFDSRADAEFNSGIELLKSFGEKVGRAVPESMFTFGVFPLEEFQGGVVVDGARDVPVGSVDGGRKDFFRQLRAERAGDVERGHAVFIFTLTAVGKRDFYHLLLKRY